jgi:hypothetical protein
MADILAKMKCFGEEVLRKLRAKATLIPQQTSTVRARI